MTTPTRLGIATSRRLRTTISIVCAPRLCGKRRIASSEWRIENAAVSWSLFATPYSLFAIFTSPFRQRAIVEPAVEPVLIARDVLLHRDVGVGLQQRDARDVGEGEVDEALHVLLVSPLVAAGGRIHGAVDEAVHRLRLVAHRVEDRIAAVIAPDEEVLGIVEPTREHVD